MIAVSPLFQQVKALIVKAKESSVPGTHVKEPDVLAHVCSKNQMCWQNSYDKSRDNVRVAVMIRAKASLTEIHSAAEQSPCLNRIER